jgi:3',5'-cyclic AMP phosphodiesterase CpdA
MNSADNNAPNPTVRLAHFSDIHITARPLGWRHPDWLTKRFPAWLNLRVLGRAYRFRHADRVLAALVSELNKSRPDHVIFSGDATALGFESELIRAADMLGLRNGSHLPGLAVPGNHDFCTHAAERSGDFERHFSPWQQGERVDDAVYPFAQRVGHAWLIAVNSSTANRWAWDASGAVDADQLSRLTRLLERLSAGPRILVTHYPVCLHSGRPESRSHGLRNLSELVSIATQGRIAVWLHGHRHGAYHHQKTDLAPFPVICAGSATQNGRWSYVEYLLAGNMLSGMVRRFDPASERFQEADKFEMQLREAGALEQIRKQLT